MKLSIDRNLSLRLIAHLRAHIKEKYRYHKVAADAYGISMNRMKKIFSGRYSPTVEMLEDAGVKITWEAQ